MGWFGHGIYDGDCTQTRHIDFLKWAKICKTDDEAHNMLGVDGTLLSGDQRSILKKNSKLILNKMPKTIKNEYDAIEWQMLLSLFIDNNIKPLKIIEKNGIAATKMLMKNYSDDFDDPKERKYILKCFLDNVRKNK